MNAGLGMYRTPPRSVRAGLLRGEQEVNEPRTESPTLEKLERRAPVSSKAPKGWPTRQEAM
jgi:hypothetical protein